MITTACLRLLVLLAIIFGSPTLGAVGVFNTRFTATDSQPPATIDYRLNRAASVTIDIVSASQQVVYSLGPFAESSGPHTHTWDGSGAGTAAGPYRARIRAESPALGNAHTLQPIIQTSGSVTLYGIAIDKCPTSPGYGTIYVSEVTFDGRIRAYYADGSRKLGFGGNPADNVLSLQMSPTGSDAPWGIGVDSQGNIHAARRCAAGVTVGVKVFDHQGNALHQVSISELQGNFWADGIVGPQGLEVYETVGTAVRAANVSDSVWRTVMGPAVAGREPKQLCFETSGAACYVATRTKVIDPGNPNPGVTRYTRQSGGEWTRDTGFESGLGGLSSLWGPASDYAIGVACDGRDPDGAGPYTASSLWVSLECANGPFGGNIVRVRLPSGAPEVYAGPGPIGRLVAADGVGNVAVEYGLASRLLWSQWGLYEPGGEASSDLRTTNEITLVGSGGPEELGTIAEIKSRPSGALVELVSGKAVSAVYADAFYIEEADRSSGLRVEGAPPPALGAMVKVRGRVQTVRGERVLSEAEIVP